MPSVAFAEVYESNAAFAWRCLRRLGVREADLEDVVQEVFVVVHRKLPSFDGRSTIKTWLFGICLRVSSDYRRRAHVQREDITDQVPDSEVDAQQPDTVAMRQARSILDRILETLDEDKRATFVMFELEQMPMTDVAAAMDCPLQTAYARLYAARRIVEEAVARHKEVAA